MNKIQPIKLVVPRVADTISLRELTVRGLVLGALITVVFTASNIYLGLKIGLTFSSSIPAAVIAMAVLRLARGSNILENNVVQTMASSGGTLSAVIFILPGLVMIGLWHGFPFWQTAGICAIGGILGVLYSAPLRTALVVESELPYPEGVAAAAILHVGSRVPGETAAAAPDTAEPGVTDLVAGSIVGAGFSILAGGMKLLAENMSWWFASGGAVFRVGTGFSMALLGAGYLVGLVGGLAMLLGVVMAWGVAVPVLTAMTPMPANTTIAVFATGIWSQQVRFMGAGVIGIGAVYTLLTLLPTVFQGMLNSLKEMRHIGDKSTATEARSERNIPIVVVMAASLLLILPMLLVFYWFLAASAVPLSAGLFWVLVVVAVLYAFAFGFLIAAAAGYMAGLVGSSSSPISGIGIVAVSLLSLLLLVMLGGSGMLSTPEGSKLGIAIALFTTAAIVAVATTSNNNLQDLKTGWMVGGTPWRQQVALMLGGVVCALVIPPILDLLYSAYGFPGAMPREGMDALQSLAAPQATLMAAIATGIFTHKLDWTMILIGLGVGACVVAVDALLARRHSVVRVPVLAVGIGIYLPPEISVTIVIGAIIGWLINRSLRRRANAAGLDPEAALERPGRRGVLLASGLIVGESLIGVLMAGIIGASGNQAPLAVVGAGFAPIAQWLGLAAFVLICVAYYVRVVSAGREAERSGASG